MPMKEDIVMNNENTYIFTQPIEAILPSYDQLGNNTCQVISSQGTSTTFPVSVSRLIRSWFLSLHIDLYAQRMWSQEILGQRNLNPIIIHEDHILIPVKIREAVGSKDGCYGYFRLTSIQKITPEYILLSSGAKIPYLSTMKTIHTKMRHAKLLGYIYIQELRHYHTIYKNKDY